jgi:hypothetical protein
LIVSVAVRAVTKETALVTKATTVTELQPRVISAADAPAADIIAGHPAAVAASAALPDALQEGHPCQHR